MDRERIEPEQQRLGPAEGCVRSDVSPIAERHQPSGAGIHVPAGVAKADRRDGEVGQQVDALEMSGAHGIVIGALVESAQRRRRSCHHVAHPGAPSANGRRQAERLLLCLLTDLVREHDRIGRTGIDLAAFRGLPSEVFGGRLREPGLAEALHEAGQGLSAGGGVIGGHAVDHPLQRASATTA